MHEEAASSATLKQASTRPVSLYLPDIMEWLGMHEAAASSAAVKQAGASARPVVLAADHTASV